MKNIIALFILSIGLSLTAQNDSIKHKYKFPFIRVYDLDRKKIAKGKIEIITDSAIFFKKKYNPIHFDNIGFIKTKHSRGHNVGVGAAIGGSIFLYPAVASGDEAWLGFAALSIVGATFGGITAIAKESDKYVINGDINMFLDFKKSIYINSVIYYYE